MQNADKLEPLESGIDADLKRQLRDFATALPKEQRSKLLVFLHMLRDTRNVWVHFNVDETGAVSLLLAGPSVAEEEHVLHS